MRQAMASLQIALGLLLQLVHGNRGFLCMPSRYKVKDRVTAVLWIHVAWLSPLISVSVRC